jgi:3-oxoacyl-[acyl-carrier-protein] synthase III
MLSNKRSNQVFPGPSACYLRGLSGNFPEKVVSSDEIEEVLAPLYTRLKLNPGRLELMTGVKQRHVGEIGERPSKRAVQAARQLMDETGVKASQVDLLIYAGVCRDALEPATASTVHSELGLSPDCLFFDLSNACLGMLNAWWVASQMIESGSIRCALVVASENSGPVLKETLDLLNADLSITRKSLKKYIANLTLGSGALASFLVGEEMRTNDSHLLAAASFRANSAANALCRGEGGVSGMMMETDSEKLLMAGLELAEQNWQKARDSFPWDPLESDHFITHQVGEAHRRLLVQTLGLTLEKTPQYYQSYGNTGSVALPWALALAAAENGGTGIQRGQRVALLGIGSGLGSLIMGVIW